MLHAGRGQRCQNPDCFPPTQSLGICPRSGRCAWSHLLWSWDWHTTRRCHLQNPPEWGISGGLPVVIDKKKGWNRLCFSLERLDQWRDLDQPGDSDKVLCYQTKGSYFINLLSSQWRESDPLLRLTQLHHAGGVLQGVCSSTAFPNIGGLRELLKNMLAPSPMFPYTEEQHCRGEWWSPQQVLRTWVATGIASGVFETTHIVSFCIEKPKKQKDKTEKSSGESQLYQSGNGSKEQLQPHMIMTAYSSL